MNLETQKLVKIFQKYPAIKLAYFFGSRANGSSGPLSDYDFAFYLNEKKPSKRLDIRLDLFSTISKILKTDNIDIIILNDTESPELKYNIIKDGTLIYEKEPFQMLIEPKIFNEYFDLHESLVRHGLTRAK